MNKKLFIKYAKTGVHYVSSNIRNDFSIKTGINIAKPRQVYYLVSEKCNLTCTMCPQWKRGIKENTNDWVSVERIKDILHEMANWGVLKFGISGGEPLLFRDKLFALLKTANSLGIYSHFVTNGWLLVKEVFLDYEKIGGGHISLSIDGIGDTHDKLRGREGLYSRCINALDLYRSLNLNATRIKINSVISSKNIHDIDRILEIGVEYKIPLFFQPFDPFNYGDMQKMSQDEMHAAYPLWVPSAENEHLEEKIRHVIKFKQKYPELVLNNMDHLNLMLPYFKIDMNGLRRKCIAAYETIFVYPNGDVRFCWFGVIGNLKDRSLKNIYHSARFVEVRNQALNCEYPCMLGCLNRPRLLELLRFGFKNLGGG